MLFRGVGRYTTNQICSQRIVEGGLAAHHTAAKPAATGGWKNPHGGIHAPCSAVCCRNPSGAFLSHRGYPHGWMVSFMENPPINGWKKEVALFQESSKRHGFWVHFTMDMGLILQQWKAAACCCISIIRGLGTSQVLKCESCKSWVGLKHWYYIYIYIYGEQAWTKLISFKDATSPLSTAETWQKYCIPWSSKAANGLEDLE